ncbi:nucleotidyltransferase family protein [Metabacillus sp. cB07]|uniref:nucleotidyltransferase domain-containing protein n=1 Tax=Metabacillus sp. cB07 TaxID=2806989 RepID=UPI00193A8F59|nr:nucleotidyltransferase family protein [Metabacillus sp. cB07]
MNLDLSKLPRELKIILELLKNQSPELLKEKSKNLFHKIDWQNFVQLCIHHRVYPLIYPRLKLIPVDIVPEHIICYLEDKFKFNTFKMLFLCTEMEQISRKLLSEKIRVLFLKGPALAHELYGDISLRTSSDLDFIVPFEELNKTEALLESMGYKKNEYIKTILGDWKWRHHHFTYFHPEKKIKAEVHWRLNPAPGFEPGFEQLWTQKKRSQLAASPIYLLGKEHLFLFLVSHGARHGWSRLRWLADIQQLIGSGLDWSKIYESLKNYHMQSEGVQAITLAAELLSTKIPPYLNKISNREKSVKTAQSAIFYLENRVNLHTDPVPDYVSKYHAKYIFAMMSNTQKLNYIISFLFPFPEDAETLPLPLRYHSLYFILHPFLWAWRKTLKETRYLRGQKS